MAALYPHRGARIVNASTPYSAAQEREWDMIVSPLDVAARPSDAPLLLDTPVGAVVLAHRTECASMPAQQTTTAVSEPDALFSCALQPRFVCVPNGARGRRNSQACAPASGAVPHVAALRALYPAAIRSQHDFIAPYPQAAAICRRFGATRVGSAFGAAYWWIVFEAAAQSHEVAAARAGTGQRMGTDVILTLRRLLPVAALAEVQSVVHDPATAALEELHRLWVQARVRTVTPRHPCGVPVVWIGTRAIDGTDAQPVVVPDPHCALGGEQRGAILSGAEALLRAGPAAVAAVLGAPARYFPPAVQAVLEAADAGEAARIPQRLAAAATGDVDAVLDALLLLARNVAPAVGSRVRLDRVTTDALLRHAAARYPSRLVVPCRQFGVLAAFLDRPTFDGGVRLVFLHNNGTASCACTIAELLMACEDERGAGVRERGVPSSSGRGGATPTVEWAMSFLRRQSRVLAALTSGAAEGPLRAERGMVPVPPADVPLVLAAYESHPMSRTLAGCGIAELVGIAAAAEDRDAATISDVLASPAAEDVADVGAHLRIIARRRCGAAFHFRLLECFAVDPVTGQPELRSPTAEASTASEADSESSGDDTGDTYHRVQGLLQLRTAGVLAGAAGRSRQAFLRRILRAHPSYAQEVRGCGVVDIADRRTDDSATDSSSDSDDKVSLRVWVKRGCGRAQWVRVDLSECFEANTRRLLQCRGIPSISESQRQQPSLPMRRTRAD